jgi:RNA polymerase sigma-70 factor (ECF subfamily)
MDSSAAVKMAQGQDDSVLVARTRRRDQEAFAVLYDRYSRLVYSIALRVVRNAAAAEDILHDVFLQLWQAPERFDAARGNLPAWMAVIARNRAIDRIRQQRATVDPEETILMSPADMGSEVEQASVVRKVRGLLQAMPEPQRRAMEMAFFDGKTHAEIAASMNEPLGTVKTRIRSALTAIRKALQA